jgi:hypothetical protein
MFSWYFSSCEVISYPQFQGTPGCPGGRYESDLERVEDVERVIREVEPSDAAEAGCCRNLADPFLADSRAGAFAANYQRLRLAIVQAGCVSKRTKQ